MELPDDLPDDLADWRRLTRSLHARFRPPDYASGLRFVAAVGAAAEAADHHPDLTLRYDAVDVALISHDVGRVTARDLRLARRVSELAAEHGLAPEPTSVAVLELALDTADLAAVRPFWAALLTGSADGADGEEIVDCTGQLPTIWFQGPDPHAPPRQRFHVDLWLPHDVAPGRVAAAVRAGGRVVDDRSAPAYVVLADPEGNAACVCTSRGR